MKVGKWGMKGMVKVGKGVIKVRKWGMKGMMKVGKEGMKVGKEGMGMNMGTIH